MHFKRSLTQIFSPTCLGLLFSTFFVMSSYGAIQGKCGTAVANTCAAGDFHPHPPDTNTDHNWTCRNRPHRGETRCRKSRSEDNGNPQLGRCGSDPYTCEGGVVYQLDLDNEKNYGGTDTKRIWVCRNTQGHYNGGPGGWQHTGEIFCSANESPPVPHTSSCSSTRLALPSFSGFGASYPFEMDEKTCIVKESEQKKLNFEYSERVLLSFEYLFSTVPAYDLYGFLGSIQGAATKLQGDRISTKKVFTEEMGRVDKLVNELVSNNNTDALGSEYYDFQIQKNQAIVDKYDARHSKYSAIIPQIQSAIQAISTFDWEEEWRGRPNLCGKFHYHIINRQRVLFGDKHEECYSKSWSGCYRDPAFPGNAGISVGKNSPLPTRGGLMSKIEGGVSSYADSPIGGKLCKRDEPSSCVIHTRFNLENDDEEKRREQVACLAELVIDSMFLYAKGCPNSVSAVTKVEYLQKIILAFNEALAYYRSGSDIIKKEVIPCLEERRDLLRKQDCQSKGNCFEQCLEEPSALICIDVCRENPLACVPVCEKSPKVCVNICKEYPEVCIEICKQRPDSPACTNICEESPTAPACVCRDNPESSACSCEHGSDSPECQDNDDDDNNNNKKKRASTNSARVINLTRGNDSVSGANKGPGNASGDINAGKSPKIAINNNRKGGGNSSVQTQSLDSKSGQFGSLGDSGQNNRGLGDTTSRGQSAFNRGRNRGKKKSDSFKREEAENELLRRKGHSGRRGEDFLSRGRRTGSTNNFNLGTTSSLGKVGGFGATGNSKGVGKAKHRPAQENPFSQSQQFWQSNHTSKDKRKFQQNDTAVKRVSENSELALSIEKVARSPASRTKAGDSLWVQINKAYLRHALSSFLIERDDEGDDEASSEKTPDFNSQTMGERKWQHPKK